MSKYTECTLSFLNHQIFTLWLGDHTLLCMLRKALLPVYMQIYMRGI